MYVALNISATSVRILSAKGRRVEKWGTAPLSPGLVKDGLIIQPEAVARAIDALFKSTGIPKERVIISLTGLPFTYRIMTLPRIKTALLEEAIQRGARKEIPLPLEELYLSWQAIGGSRDELDFFVLGVSRNLVDAIVQTMIAAGLEPYLMDLKPLALARAANRGEAVIVDLEPDCFDIILVTGGVPAIMRTISPGGEGASLEDNVRRLADGLSKTVNFYDSSHPGNTLSLATPLLLTGELSSDDATIKLIQSESEYPAEPLVPLLKFPPDFPVAIYAANMGLVLKKLPRKISPKGDATRFHDIDLNILSGKYRRGAARPVPMRHILIGTALIIAIGLMFPIYQARSNSVTENVLLQTELRTISQELNQARLAIDEAKLVEDTISKIAAEAEILNQEHQSIIGNEGDFTGNLKLVASILPPQTRFTSVEMSTHEIIVEGEADNPFTVVSYVVALEAEGVFSEVRIVKIDERKGAEAETAAIGSTTISFKIVITRQD